MKGFDKRERYSAADITLATCDKDCKYRKVLWHCNPKKVPTGAESERDVTWGCCCCLGYERVSAKTSSIILDLTFFPAKLPFNSRQTEGESLIFYLCYPSDREIQPLGSHVTSPGRGGGHSQMSDRPHKRLSGKTAMQCLIVSFSMIIYQGLLYINISPFPYLVFTFVSC